MSSQATNPVHVVALDETEERLMTKVCENQSLLFSEAASLLGFDKQTSFRGADLRGEDLSGDNLQGFDFSDADLSGANVQGADLREAIFNRTLLRNISQDEYTLWPQGILPDVSAGMPEHSFEPLLKSSAPALDGFHTFRPRVFIASSYLAAESGVVVAATIKRLLGDAVVAEVWNENMIRAAADGAPRSRGEVMTNLYKAARYYDFVIVLLGRSSAEETARAHGLQPVRDNLLFEMGLFMGGLSAKRTLVALEPGPTKAELGLPSDLFGDAFGHPPVQLLSDEEAVLRRQVEIIRDAILEADAKTGLSLLPSTGAAIGYFKNFIQPVAEYLLSDEFRIDDQIYHARETSYVFDIVMPASLERAGFRQRAEFVEKNKAELEERKVTIGRPYHFFVRKGEEGARLHLVDFPTTLAASVEVINLIIDDEMKSLEDIDYAHASMTPRQLLEAKELSNFERTLCKLLTQQLTMGKTAASREFPTRVRLRYLKDDLSIDWNPRLQTQSRP